MPRAAEEEDEVEEIEREESRPQAIQILCKRGDEVVVVEEEDTTREVKRLRSTLSTAMKQIKVSIVSVMSVFGGNLHAIALHSMNYQTTVASDQEDGAPCRGEHKAEGGGEAYGEKCPEGLARA